MSWTEWMLVGIAGTVALSVWGLGAYLNSLDLPSVEDEDVLQDS